MTMGEKDDAPLSLKDLIGNYLAIARRGLRYWGRGSAVFLVVLAAGMAWVITKPRTYRSEARFQVQEPDVPGGQERGAEEIQRSLDNRLSQVFGSRTNVLALVNRLNLYPRLRGHTSDTKLAEQVWGSLDRSVVADTVQLGFKYGDPEDAQRVVQGFIDLFVNARRATAVTQAREALATVDAQFRQLETALADRQDALDQFVLANQSMVEEVRARRGGPTRIQIGTNGAPGTSPTRAPEADSHASLRTRGVLARIGRLNASLEALRNPTQVAAPSADEPPDLQALRERVRAKQTEVDGYRARGLTPDYPTRASAERELQGLNTQLAAAVARFRGNQQSAASMSQTEREQRIEQVNRELQQARVELADSQRTDSAASAANPSAPPPPTPVRNPLTRNNIVEVEAEFDRLTTDVTTTRTSYTEVLHRKLERTADLRRSELSGGEQIRILDAPSRPVEPEPPGRVKLTMIVMVLAMILAFGTALLSGIIDTRIYDQDDLRRWGELAELPFIPDLHHDAPPGGPRVPSMHAPPAAPG